MRSLLKNHHIGALPVRPQRYPWGPQLCSALPWLNASSVPCHFCSYKRHTIIPHACQIASACPTLCDLMACSPPASSVHGVLQARMLEWVAISSSWTPSSYPQKIPCTVTSRGGTDVTWKFPLCELISQEWAYAQFVGYWVELIMWDTWSQLSKAGSPSLDIGDVLGWIILVLENFLCVVDI